MQRRKHAHTEEERDKDAESALDGSPCVPAVAGSFECVSAGSLLSDKIWLRFDGSFGCRASVGPEPRRASCWRRGWNRQSIRRYVCAAFSFFSSLFLSPDARGLFATAVDGLAVALFATLTFTRYATTIPCCISGVRYWEKSSQTTCKRDPTGGNRTNRSGRDCISKARENLEEDLVICGGQVERVAS